MPGSNKKEQPKKTAGFKNEWSFANYVEKRDQQNEGVMDAVKDFGQKAALAGSLISPFAGAAQANKPPPLQPARQVQPAKQQQMQQQQFKTEFITIPVNIKIKPSSTGHAPDDLNAVKSLLNKKAWLELELELKSKGIDKNQVRAFMEKRPTPVVADDALDNEQLRTDFNVNDLVYDGTPFGALPKGKINAKTVELHGQVTFRIVSPK